jgi:hypothetical protein
MLYIDIKYANSIGITLRNYKIKSNNPFVANFSCPLCGDGKKKTKKRGYFYTKFANLLFHCHNCGNGSLFSKFLKEQNSELYKQYAYEKFIDKGTDLYEPATNITEKTYHQSLLDKLLDRCDLLPRDHPAVQYLDARKIPKEKYSGLYFIDDIRKISELNPKYADKMNDKEERIVIPCYDRKGILIGLQCRSINNKGLRYVIIKLTNKEVDLVYNLSEVNLMRRVLVVEGHFDSMFLKNSIAFGNSSLHLSRRVLQYSVDAVLVFDNEPRNRELTKLMERALDDFPIVIWPQSIVAKDINDMILDGMGIDEVNSVISMNTFTGLSAKMAFNNWKRS